MQRINSFRILNISMQGFKCFKDKVEFDFGVMTIIRGANGLGKSSIADAISFAFMGTNFFGEKGLDKLHNPVTPEMEVSVGLCDDNGEHHILVRTRKNDMITISFDGYNVRQADMNEIFGEKDLFLSLFNPIYFIDTLGAEGKELLEKILPVVRHEDVLQSLSEQLRSTLENEIIISPETYVKNKRAEIRELENNLVYMQGQSDLHDEQVKKANESVIKITGELNAIENQMVSLETERDANRLKTDDEERLAKLYQQLDELVTEKEDNTEINRFLHDIRTKEIELAKLASSLYQPLFTAQIAEKKAALKALYKEYDELNGLIGRLRPGYQCPSCFHEVTEDNIIPVKAVLKNRLKQCVDSGKQVKSELASIEDKEISGLQLFTENNAKKTAALNSQLHELKEQCQAAEADRIIAESERTETAGKIKEDIQLLEYRRENGNLTLAQLREMDNLRQKKRELESQLEVYQAILDKPGFDKQMEKTEKEIARLNILVNNTIYYAGKKNELTFKGLDMNRVRILLFEIIKSTGEIKDTFKFTYEGKDYKRLSLSEKVRAGLEVAELIKKLSGRNFPTFIDNSESICVIDNIRPTSQLIFSRVEKGIPLSVTQKEPAYRKAG